MDILPRMLTFRCRRGQRPETLVADGGAGDSTKILT